MSNQEEIQLNIFLIKESKKDVSSIIEGDDHESYTIKIDNCQECTLYIKKSETLAPKWCSFFNGFGIKNDKNIEGEKITDFQDLKSDVSAVLIIKPEVPGKVGCSFFEDKNDKNIESEKITDLQDLKSDVSAVLIIKPEVPGKVWRSFCEGKNDKNIEGEKITDLQDLKSDVSAVLIIKPKVRDGVSSKISDRYFALTFGHGGRSLLKNNVYTYRFGLFVALKSVDKSSIRCIDKKSWDTIQSHAKIQSGKETTVDRFGIDIEQDMLKAIVGTPKEPRLGSRMTGTDSLSVTVKTDIVGLSPLLLDYGKQYEDELSDEYKWVENIFMVENSSDINIDDLNEKLLAKFNDKKYSESKLWLEIPEIIRWDQVKGFKFRDNDENPKPDINLEDFLLTVRENQDITLQFLKSRKVFCVHNDGTFEKWSVFKCIYFEIKLPDANTYILNDGKWFKVDNNFVGKTDEYFQNIDRLNIKELGWPKYKGGGEKQYNSEVANKLPWKYILLDGKIIRPGGGHRQIEICDLFSEDKHLIHVKKSKVSSVLSHLISQGFVSGQLLQIDSDFRMKVKEELAKVPARRLRRLQRLRSSKRPQRLQELQELQEFLEFLELYSDIHKDLIIIDSRPKDQEFTIVYAIIKESKSNDKLSLLPFFSRVNMNNAVKILLGFGYKVKLLEINYDDKYLEEVIAKREEKKKEKKKKEEEKKKKEEEKSAT